MADNEYGEGPEIKSATIKKKTRVRASAKKATTLGQVKVEQRSTRPIRPGLLQFTLYFIYKNLYILGIYLLRVRLRWVRRLKMRISRIKGTVFAFNHNVALGFVRLWNNIAKRMKAPFLRIGAAYSQQAPAIRTAKQMGKGGFAARLPVIEAVARLIWKIISSVFNYCAPVVAAVFLLTTINNQLTKPVGLLLEYNGQVMGYIENETSFDAAAQLVKERFVGGSNEYFTTEIPSFILEQVDVDEFIEIEDLADMLIRSSGGEIEEAYGLYVSNRLEGAVTDKDAILDVLDAIRDKGRTGKPDERIEFVKKIRLSKGLYPVTSLGNVEELVEKLESYEESQETYTVQEGDTPTGIADKIPGMTYAQLLDNNPTIEEDLQPGMELITKVAKPYLSVKSIYTDVYEEEIDYEVKENENAMHAKSYRQVTTEGVTGLRRVTAEITTVNGMEIFREIIGEPIILREPVTEQVTVGIKNPDTIISMPSGSPDMSASGNAPKSSGFIWPTTGGYATTYRNHSGNGVDIAIGAGVPIYAAAAGTVQWVKYGYTGYGMHLLIDHGNGYQTLYAHNSAMYVVPGQQVAQGQKIADMGRTGMATGNHLHFEVRYNGRYMNPTDYIGYRP